MSMVCYQLGCVMDELCPPRFTGEALTPSVNELEDRGFQEEVRID